MALSDKAEEILEELWIQLEEQKDHSIDAEILNETSQSAPMQELIGGDYINFSREGKIAFTPRGRTEAESIVRRHRLAERLLLDVLDVRHHLMDETACQFEHLLHRGIDDSICTLLGHPKTCPHGKPIPSGRCCQERRRTGEQVVLPLSDMTPGQLGKIAYIHAQDSRKLQKLMAMGILPGTSINAIQRAPSYVFQVGHTQYAVDQEISEAIYVRLERFQRADEIA